MIYHIRERVALRGGNNFYRDKSVRETATACGAECTAYDAAWSERKRAGDWIHETHGEMIACIECLRSVARRTS